MVKTRGGEDTSRKVIIDGITGGLPVEIVSTSAGAAVEAIDLGGRTIQVIPIPGVSETGVAYLDAEAQILFTGAGIGSGTAELMATCGYVSAGTPEQVSYAINTYRTYGQSVATLCEKTQDMENLAVMTSAGKMDAAYLSDMATLIDMFLNADNSLRLEYIYEGVNGDKSGNFKCSYGSAEIIVHMPFMGLYGYRLAGASMYADDSNDKFYVCDFGSYLALRDTDVQTTPLLMNDTQALIIDVNYYNPELYIDTLMNLIGDRELHIYITHAHPDHIGNLPYFDPERVTKLYWPGEETPNMDLSIYGDKLVRVYSGDVLNVAGKELVVYNMTSHTKYGTMLINLTDRVALCGDTLGTQTYWGDPSVGSLTMEEYEAQIDYLIENYGDAIDYVHQAHSPYPLSDEWYLGALKEMIAAFRADRDLYVHEGFLTYYINGVLTNDQYYGVFSSPVTDSQYYYTVSLKIGNN